MWLKLWHKFHREDCRGHLNECSYVLINIFGMSDSQVKELNKSYSDYTNDDLDLVSESFFYLEQFYSSEKL